MPFLGFFFVLFFLFRLRLGFCVCLGFGFGLGFGSGFGLCFGLCFGSGFGLLMLCFIVRHTPAFVFVHRFAIGTATGSSFSPLREGMARQRFLDNTLTIYVMRQPIPSRRGVAEGRGVSHRQTIKLCFGSHRQTGRNRGVSHRQNNRVVFCVVLPNRQESGCVAPSNNRFVFCVVLSNRQKSGHSAPAVEKGAVICLYFGCFYALTFCISVNNSVFVLFCACLCRFCFCRCVSRSFCGLFSGSVVTFLKIFFLFQVVANQWLRRIAVFSGENFFW